MSPDRLSLAPGALAEVHLAFRPLVPGRADVVVHLVDLENRRLVHSRVVATDARGPSVSKTFDVAAVPGARSHKKITYTNPYPRPRAFNLRCTHPLLLHFRPETLELGANASKPMGLTFEPAEAWAKAASSEAKLEGAGRAGEVRERARVHQRRGGRHGGVFACACGCERGGDGGVRVRSS